MKTKAKTLKNESRDEKLKSQEPQLWWDLGIMTAFQVEFDYHSD